MHVTGAPISSLHSPSNRSACRSPAGVSLAARPPARPPLAGRLPARRLRAATSSSLPPYVPGFSPAAAAEEGGDPLLLTLGQGQAAPPPAPTLPSPMAAGLLLSLCFIFSPNTMQAIQELSPLF